MPKGGSNKARDAARARRMRVLRVWFIAVAVTVTAVLVLLEVVSGGRGSDVAERLLGARDISKSAELIGRAADDALEELGVVDLSREEEPAERGRYRWTHVSLRGRIPYGVGLFEINLAVSEAVRAAEGRVIRVNERGPDWRGLRTLDMRFGVGDLETHRVVLKESQRSESDAGGRVEPLTGGSAPRIAIVIDDFGCNESSTATAFLEIDARLTVSVLPHYPCTATMAEAARCAGKEVLLHLPMEPERYPEIDPGANALLVDQSAGEISRLVEDALKDVPGAVGVNNHMGSAFTKDRGRMRVVMSALREADLFFLDSMTTPLSAGHAEATLAGVPVARNSLFIDSVLDDPSEHTVESRLEELEAIARKRGAAIGIGHPSAETLGALLAVLPGMEERGIEFVGVSETIR